MPTSALILDESTPASRTGMLSRVASLIYWTARQLERAENTVRLVDVNAQLVLDLEARRHADDPRAWEPLVFVTGDDEGFHKLYGDRISEETVVKYLLFDRENPSSYVSCIAAARENARCIQDQIASEMWETLNTFYHELSTHSYRTYQKLGAGEYLGQLKLHIQQLYGVAESMLPRDEGWWFYLLGRYLERADNVSRIIDIKYFMILPDLHEVGSALDIVQWASVLRSCSGFEAFRRSKRGQLTLERAVDYLLFDDEFPRSILASIIYAENCLRKITAEHEDGDQNPVLEMISKLRGHLENSAVTAIIADGLHEYLDDIQVRLSETHSAVHQNFFDYNV